MHDQSTTLVNFKKNFFKFIINFLSFTLQQISTKDCDIVKFPHTFYFNDQCPTVSGRQLICLKFNLPNPNPLENGSANPTDSAL